MWELRHSQDLTLTDCPICNLDLIRDYDKGELVCTKCGFVAEDQKENHGAEWKAFDPEEKEKRTRAGSPRRFALQDFGLSTEIGVGTRDSHGKKLDPFVRMTIDRMKKWQKRIKTLSSEERWLSNILPNILESSYALSLPQIVSETAAHLCRISWKQRVIQNKSSLGMTAAFVYLACRKCGVGRSLKEVAKAVGIEKRTAAKHYRYLLREVEKEYMPTASVEKYISKLANIAKIDPRTERLALWIAGRTRDVDISSGKLPAGLAAAYVYIASVLNGERIAQREIAEYAEVTEVTVRSRCKEMFDSFIICQRLHAMNGERKTE